MSKRIKVVLNTEYKITNITPKLLKTNVKFTYYSFNRINT